MGGLFLWMVQGAWANTCVLEESAPSFLQSLQEITKPELNQTGTGQAGSLAQVSPFEKGAVFGGVTLSTHWEKATFAGGCFWCVEARFEKVQGVREAVSGFAGGRQVNPSYKEVSQGKTDHVEAVQIVFNPEVVSYENLLDVYWSSIDPTDSGGQFADRGATYRPLIFYHNEAQKKSAEKSKKALAESGIFEKPIVVEIIPYTTFFKAEEYHQNYHKKNPVRYYLYNNRSGRVDFLKKKWKNNSLKTSVRKPQSVPWRVSLSVMSRRKQNLTPLQYKVTQEEGTETPFKNEYWNHKEEGIYVDIISGEPLFSSKDKYDSKTGWPSFTRPLVAENIKTKTDNKLGMKRTEVRSRLADSHLGHVFADGPPPTGLRYCINSASLRFISRGKLQEEGYGEFQKLFSTNDNKTK